MNTDTQKRKAQSGKQKAEKPWTCPVCECFDLGCPTCNLKAHADKLAEALQHLTAITRNDDALQYKEARAALAAYEEAK